MKVIKVGKFSYGLACFDFDISLGLGVFSPLSLQTSIILNVMNSTRTLNLPSIF
ncbi:hypothetical protein EDC04DRAFT_2893574 [Pisolithus marmoratus]|nr:hypothetical protein EDC04DRAFT_2893574 [Pisolithus marmoratus]